MCHLAFLFTYSAVADVPTTTNIYIPFCSLSAVSDPDTQRTTQMTSYARNHTHRHTDVLFVSSVRIW